MFSGLSLLGEEGAVLVERFDGGFFDIVFCAYFLVYLSELFDALVVLDELRVVFGDIFELLVGNDTPGLFGGGGDRAMRLDASNFGFQIIIIKSRYFNFPIILVIIQVPIYSFDIALNSIGLFKVLSPGQAVVRFVDSVEGEHFVQGVLELSSVDRVADELDFRQHLAL